ncbi:MAG: NUDIX domain-containing protein [Chloroflexota bacterium]|nr:NUDIX domain-containing protein [Chloroflexota bacterium]
MHPQPLRAGAAPVLRRAARVLLIDARERILLFRAEGDFADGSAIWLTPGGGLKPSESYARAARRELWEETGLDAEVGACVWTRRHVYPNRGRLEEARERFFVVRCAPFEVDRTHWEPAEAADLTAHRWWPLPEIAASDEVFVPRRLAALLTPILRGEMPPRPTDCGI